MIPAFQAGIFVGIPPVANSFEHAKGVFLHYLPGFGNAIGLRWRRTLVQKIAIELYRSKKKQANNFVYLKNYLQFDK